MIRTQVYLPEDLYYSIDQAARKEKKVKAAIIREALQRGLTQKRAKKNAGQALLELAKLGEKLNFKAPKDLSVNHDKYLYEDD